LPLAPKFAFEKVQKMTILYTVIPQNESKITMNSDWPGQPPTPENYTVGKPRNYLLPTEVDLLMATARKRSRNGHRDATMILMAYRHGLRASEVCSLEWSQVELSAGRLHVRRAKNGTPSVHVIQGDEIRALRRLYREDAHKCPYVFVSERGAPMTPIGFNKLISRLGKAAGMLFPIHPHMLRHACGFKLANDGHDTRSLQHWMGHKNIANTVIYTAMSTDRFKNFWK
jgi:type 1 fimbriae regulatory protein FimB/type 1 fimbriae regulatory protein FimE